MGGSPVTMTVCDCSPGCSERSIRTSFPTSSNKPECSIVLKPLASTRAEYVPGSRSGATYSPAWPVVKVRETPLWASKTVTMAPAIVPPLASVTVPEMRPRLPCANKGRQITNNKIVAPGISEIVLARRHHHSFTMALTESIRTSHLDVLLFCVTPHTHP